MYIYTINPLGYICCATLYKGTPTQRQLAGRCEDEKWVWRPISKTTQSARDKRLVLQTTLFMPLLKEIGYAFAYTNTYKWLVINHLWARSLISQNTSLISCASLGAYPSGPTKEQIMCFYKLLIIVDDKDKAKARRCSWGCSILPDTVAEWLTVASL